MINPPTLVVLWPLPKSPSVLKELYLSVFKRFGIVDSGFCDGKIKAKSIIKVIAQSCQMYYITDFDGHVSAEHVKSAYLNTTNWIGGPAWAIKSAECFMKVASDQNCGLMITTKGKGIVNM